MSGTMLLFLQTFFMLLFNHCLADFPLQGEYLSKCKDPKTNPAGIWIPALFAHSMIHAGFVFLITGYLSLALLQLFTHIFIDYTKCMGWFGDGARAFVADQLFHVGILAITANIYVILVA